MRTNRISPRLIALLTVFAVGITIGPAPVRAAESGNSDSKAKTYLVHKLASDGILKGHNINVSVARGVATLSGTVPTLHDLAKAAEISKKAGHRFKVIDELSLAAPNVPDTVLAAAVLHRVENHAFYTVFDWLTVGVNKGVVILHGWVSEPWEVGQYQAEAAKVPGVKRIINNLKVELTSGYLRYRVARLIYRNEMFRPYSTELNPPVHVVVNNDTVILEGFVDSTGERGFLGSQVTFRTDAFNVVNHLQVVPD